MLLMVLVLRLLIRHRGYKRGAKGATKGGVTTDSASLIRFGKAGDV